MIDLRSRQHVNAVRVLGPTSTSKIPDEAKAFTTSLLGQATFWRKAICTMSRDSDGRAELPVLIFDFGNEIHGGLELITRDTTGDKPVRLRITFGESLAEALSSPNQDHSIHQYVLEVPWAGVQEVGSTGFRYAKVELVDDHTFVELMNVRAVSIGIVDLRLGSFECSDARLNDVWRVGARTVELCMQTHLWDGIKRDRLIWAGDLHPEVMAVLAVFGGHPIVPKSLSFVRDESPLPGHWMNGMPTYSLWWVITLRDWFVHTADRTVIESNRCYVTDLLIGLMDLIGDDGSEKLPARFLDWASYSDEAALQIGVHALMRLSMIAGVDLCRWLNEIELARRCQSAADLLAEWAAPSTANLQANALRALAGMADPVHTNAEKLAPRPAFNLSPFYGYYVLEARAAAGDHIGCLNLIRSYWGGMLDFGATTFWEHFDADWLTHDPPFTGINDWPEPGRPNIHADAGAYCYIGFRHSLCHGWSAGPTAWMTRHVLGVTPAAAGFSRVSIIPQLAGLQWARGTVPTPHGLIRVEHSRSADGRVESSVTLPEGVILQ